MSQNTPKQTPFDDLVPTQHVPPSSPTPAPANNTLPLTGRSNAPATRVVAALQDDEPDDDTQSTVGSTPAYTPRRRMPRRVLPTGTLIGLAMVGGAVIVLALSALFMRVVPRAQTKSLPPPISQPRVVEAPPEDSDVLTADEEAEAARRAQSGAAESAASDTPSASSPAGTIGTDENSRGAAPDDSKTESGARDNDNSDTARADNTRDESSSDDSDRATRSESVTSRGDGFEHNRTGYRVQPPGGFSLQKTGKRTVWRGPRGSQFLVETSDSPGSSPRADWEKLDKALAKKYGSRYRSHGIRETTLAGRPAAVWEFEIGDTRKVDVAVHHRGTGYAVLAEANVEDFEEMRPQLESAIRSFELPASTRRRRSTPASTSRRDADAHKNGDDEGNSDGY